MNNKGYQGEQLFKQIMESRNYKVEDVSDKPEYYHTGDFLITSPTTGLTKSFEVKWDYKIHKTDNLYLEKITRFTDGVGWYDYCKADYIAYGDAINKKFYIIPLLELREKVEHMPKNLAECGNDSVGYLVSLSSLKDIYQEL